MCIRDRLLDKGVPIQKIRDVRGTVYLCHTGEKIHYDVGGSWSYADVRADKRAYARAFALQYRNQDSVNGKALTEIYDNDVMLVQNPPMPPLEREELDWVYSLPYMLSLIHI